MWGSRGPLGCTFLLAVLLGTACARQPGAAGRPSAAPPAARIDSLPADTFRARHTVRPLRLSNAFRDAVARGTRTLDGRPGDKYWQNNVEYRITAELDPATARITAMETVLLRNRSPDTLRTVLFNLYQNVFAEGAQRTRRVPITGGMQIERVVADGVAAREGAPRGRAGYRIDGTLMTVELPFPLPPGRHAELEVAWNFIVPPAGAPRTAHDDANAFVVAQWYPQIATYDDLRGWHDRPYWSNGEFYLEFGDFDVELTLPEGWLVAATGTLENPTEVLGLATAERLERASVVDEVVNIVVADDLEAKTATARAMGGQLTWHFRASGVRDFAFATSDRYLWDAVRVPAAGANGEAVLAQALYRQGARDWPQAATFMQHALAAHAARVGTYPWPHITAAEGPIAGMEYPMLVFIDVPGNPIDLYAVLSHEIAHQWWPMMVGNNETDHAWQDEGLATFVEDFTVAERFPGEDPFSATRRGYLSIAGTDTEFPIETRADLFGIGPQYPIASYLKPAALLRALGVVIGDDVLQRALREYTSRWTFRHPASFDFFHTIEDVAGRDLDWFWNSWWFDTVTLDQAIVAVELVELEGSSERITITVEDQGDAPMPVLLGLTLETGEVRTLRLPVAPWLAGRSRQSTTAEVPSAVTRVEIDPARYFPENDRRDNVWTRPVR